MDQAAGSLLPPLVLALTAYVLGRAVLRWRDPGFRDPLERGAVATALGLGLLAHLLFLLGLLRLLRPGPVLLLAAAVHLLGLPVWRRMIREIRPPRPLLALAAVALGAPLLVLALYPPTAFDATLYHLPFVRAFVESGGLPFVAELRFPVFPQANEALFAAVMLFGPAEAAHVVQLFATLLTAALLVAWGREASPSYPAAGWLAAAVFLGHPIVIHLAGTAYLEPGLTLFVTAALLAVDRWRREGGRIWLALAAVFAATAADMKYLGLFFLGAAGLVVLLAGGRERPVRARLRDAVLFSTVAAALLAPWYGRIYLLTGNPLFPFLGELFGTTVWTSSWAVPEGLPSNRAVRLARLPWDLLFNRHLYNHEPPFSPVYLAALPLLAWGFAREARVRLPLLVGAAYALVWTFLPPDSRYLVLAVPLASLAVALSAAPWLARLPDAHRRWLAIALCLGCFLPGWLYAGYRIDRQGPPPLKVEEREAYLSRALPAYPALAWLNRTRGRDYTVWALYAENLTYFAEGKFMGDWAGPARFDRVLQIPDPARVHAELRRLGATHLMIPAELVDGRPTPLPFPEDAAFQRWFRLVHASPAGRIYLLE